MSERLERAIGRIDVWLRAHGGAEIADALSPGADGAALEAAEASFGFPLPDEVRALFALHDGSEENGFLFGWNDLFSLDRALAEREQVALYLDQARRYAKDIPELASSAWIAIAGLESDLYCVSGGSGRVFECMHDDPTPKAVASSIAEWLETFAAELESEDYLVVDEGGYLTLRARDRAAEEKDAAAQLRRAALQDDSIASLVAADIAADRPHDCADVIDAAIARRLLPEALEALFERGSPAFVVEALRARLREIELTESQWKIVATGGKKVSNNAVVDLAREKLEAKTGASSSKPWWKIWS